MKTQDNVSFCVCINMLICISIVFNVWLWSHVDENEFWSIICYAMGLFRLVHCHSDHSISTVEYASNWNVLIIITIASDSCCYCVSLTRDDILYYYVRVYISITYCISYHHMLIGRSNMSYLSLTHLYSMYYIKFVSSNIYSNSF